MKKNNTIRRLLAEMTGTYKLNLFIALFLIIISTVANVAGSFFIQMLVDRYIAPLLLTDNPEFTGLLTALLIMGLIYLVGILATLFYNIPLTD